MFLKSRKDFSIGFDAFAVYVVIHPILGNKSIKKYAVNVEENSLLVKQQDAQLGIESVGHIGKDSNNNRGK